MSKKSSKENAFPWTYYQEAGGLEYRHTFTDIEGAISFADKLQEGTLCMTDRFGNPVYVNPIDTKLVNFK